MSLATDMRNLTQDIVSCRGERSKAMGEMKEDVKRIKGEAQRMKEEAQEMIMSLKATRKEESALLQKELAQQEAQRKRFINKMLKGLQLSRKADGAKMRSALAKEMTDLKSEVRSLKKETQRSLQTFHSQRERMTEDLQKELAQGVADRKVEVGSMMDEARELIMSFQAAREEGTAQLRRDLDQNRSNMTSDVKRMLSDFNKTRAEISTDLKEAAAIWQDLACSMGRFGRAKTKANTEKAKAPESRKKIESEQAQKRNLEAALLAAVEEHLDGITLAEAAKSMGVAPIALGRTSKILLDKGKIRKAAKLYFPEPTR